MKTSENIVNMLNCKQGEHCLFRSFGLGNLTDQVGLLRRSQITRELNKWYTNIDSFEITQSNGVYNIRIKGDE